MSKMTRLKEELAVLYDYKEKTEKSIMSFGIQRYGALIGLIEELIAEVETAIDEEATAEKAEKWLK